MWMKDYVLNKHKNLQSSSNKGDFGGVELEPADHIIVENVDDVWEHDEGHSSTQRSPYNNQNIFKTFSSL